MSPDDILVQWAPFFFLILPSLVLVAGAWLIRIGDARQGDRRRGLLLLGATDLALILMNLCIWANPYGRSISSSLPAYGMLPALTALLAHVFRKPEQMAHLWRSDRPLMIVLVGLAPALLLLLWFADPMSFYLVAALTGALTVAAWLALRTGLGWLSLLSLTSAALLVLLTGGSFIIRPLTLPRWLSLAADIATGLALLAALLLPPALLYPALRGDNPPAWRRLGWRLALALLLIAGSLYMVFWDGVWSSAHARAFEDHLPFVQFLLSLAGGVWLALALPGWRRLIGPGYTVLVTLAAVLALSWGWTVSAFELTASRAQRIDAAVQRYYQTTGVYPDKLEDLTPGYLLYLPPPVVVRQGSWCYQGGLAYYRLGYVSGRFTYAEREFFAETFSQAGELPPGEWNCEAMVARFAAGDLQY